MGRLYLIRHAQSTNNARWTGSDFTTDREPDPDITPIGHQQSAALASHLANAQGEPRQHPYLRMDTQAFGITHVYCSLMSRSIQTAQYVCDTLALPMVAVDDVFEKHGIYDVDADGAPSALPGPGRDYFAQRFPSLTLPAAMNDDGWWSRPFEADAAFVTRTKAAAERFATRLAASDEHIALITHGDFIDEFINQVMQVPRHQDNYQSGWLTNWTFHNTSITRIDFVDSACTCVYLNRIDHLGVAQVTW